jgi:hypothetical protein
VGLLLEYNAMKVKLKNQFGFLHLLIVLILSTLAIIPLMFSASTDLNQQTIILSNATKIKIGALKENLLTVIGDTSAWNRISDPALNTSFSCVDNDCRSMIEPANLQIVDAEGTVLLDSRAINQGIDVTGNVCRGFDAQVGNAACPFRYAVTWLPICPDVGSCARPKFRVRGQLTFKSNIASGAYNFEKFNFQIIR